MTFWKEPKNLSWGNRLFDGFKGLKRFKINQQSTFMCGLLVRLLKQLEGAHSATQDSLQYETRQLPLLNIAMCPHFLVPNNWVSEILNIKVSGQFLEWVWWLSGCPHFWLILHTFDLSPILLLYSPYFILHTISPYFQLILYNFGLSSILWLGSNQYFSYRIVVCVATLTRQGLCLKVLTPPFCFILHTSSMANADDNLLPFFYVNFLQECPIPQAREFSWSEIQ